MTEDARRVPDPELQDILTCQGDGEDGDGCGAICVRNGEDVIPHVWRERETMAGVVKELFCVDCAIRAEKNEYGLDRDTARNRVMGAISG